MQEADWNFPEGRFLSYVLGSRGRSQQPLFIVLNAAPEEISFTLPKLPEYREWDWLLDTTKTQTPSLKIPSGTQSSAPPRSVLAFAGLA